MHVLLGAALILLILSAVRSLGKPADKPPPLATPIEQPAVVERSATMQLPLRAASEELMGEFAHVDFSRPECRNTLTSQHGEEKFLYSAFWSSPNPMTNGFYLELGAFDGVGMSNSHWLDKCLGRCPGEFEGSQMGTE